MYSIKIKFCLVGIKKIVFFFLMEYNVKKGFKENKNNFLKNFEIVILLKLKYYIIW